MVDGGGIDSPESAGCPAAPAGFAAVRMCLLGRVQGVGFRPFVVRLATGLGLAGWVRNTPDGAVIHLEGPVDRLAAFRERVVGEIPRRPRFTRSPSKKSQGRVVSGSPSGRASGSRTRRKPARCPRFVW